MRSACYAGVPGFALLTVLVLGGGLGISILTFSFLHTVMLMPLPLADGKRIVRVFPATGIPSSGEIALLRPSITTLSEFGAYVPRDLVVGTAPQRRTLGATATEWNIFEFTNTAPLLGRGLRPDDQAPGAEPVIVISHRIWQAVFGAAADIVNTLVSVNGSPSRVVGVMPEGYGFPVASDAWVPLSDDVLAGRAATSHRINLYARLAPGVRADAARTELNGLLRNTRDQAARAADDRTPTTLAVESFPMAQLGGDGLLVFSVLNLCAFLILMLACVNVMNLLLARANERARETAVRLALGAPRSRLIVQNLWETIVLCVGGGVVAVALAGWGLGAINRWAQIHLEGNLAIFADVLRRPGRHSGRSDLQRRPGIRHTATSYRIGEPAAGSIRGARPASHLLRVVDRCAEAVVGSC